MSLLTPVLIAGGSGTRLWPTSRKSLPKQFVDLTDSGQSLLQATLARSTVMPDPAPWIIVTSEHYRFLVAQQAHEIGQTVDTILLEPSARNTAPAIALAAFEAVQRHENPKLLIQTADHHIENLDVFSETVKTAFHSEAPFILFGVDPSRPETGYGYIELGDMQSDGTHLVRSFKEKPDFETAMQYVNSGEYLWNSGMFMLDARAYLDALEAFEPEMYAHCQTAWNNATTDLDFKRAEPEAFDQCPSVSIDYALMERLRTLHVVPYRGDWSDVGSWDMVAAISKKDAQGNVTQGNTHLIDSEATFIRSESRLVTGIGLHNLVIVETRDAVLVADARRTQDVKRLVDDLKRLNIQAATEHQKMYRPWGSYETLIMGDRFQVKQIIVNPGASLSLQMHHHRAEHWVVVSGTAEVQIDEAKRILTEDQSVYIPLGSKHRLTNPGKLPLTLIEVQSGGYLGEDDIVRFDDHYGRN